VPGFTSPFTLKDLPLPEGAGILVCATPKRISYVIALG